MTLALALALLLSEPAQMGDDVAPGSAAPAFSLRTVNAEARGVPWVSLGRLVGTEAEDPGARVVVLSFFASWCEPCKRELPFLVELDRHYREAGLRILSIDVDAEPAGIEAARRLFVQAGTSHPVGSDRFNILAPAVKAPLPSVLLVRRDGTIGGIERGSARKAKAFLKAAVRAELLLPA